MIELYLSFSASSFISSSEIYIQFSSFPNICMSSYILEKCLDYVRVIFFSFLIILRGSELNLFNMLLSNADS